MHRFLINKSRVLKSCEPRFLAEVLPHMRVRVADAGEYIVRHGDADPHTGAALHLGQGSEVRALVCAGACPAEPCTSQVFFVERGAAELVDARGHVGAVFVEASHFGHSDVLLSAFERPSVRARERCVLLALRKSVLELVGKTFPAFRRCELFLLSQPVKPFQDALRERRDARRFAAPSAADEGAAAEATHHIDDARARLVDRCGPPNTHGSCAVLVCVCACE